VELKRDEQDHARDQLLVAGDVHERQHVRKDSSGCPQARDHCADSHADAADVRNDEEEQGLDHGVALVREDELRVGDERFRVIGVLAPRGTSLGMNLDEIVLIPVGRHMRMFNETTLPRVLVEMTSHDDLPAGKAAATALLTARHDEYDVTIETQESMLAAFSRLLRVLTAALSGIAAISLCVAGVGIMNVMLVSVSERTREIGLLKAIGATPADVLRFFLAEAAALSVVGGLAGLIAASILSATARRLFPAFPMQPPDWAAPAAVAVSLAVGMLFGVWPARRAARLDPIRALTRR